MCPPHRRCPRCPPRRPHGRIPPDRPASSPRQPASPRDSRHLTHRRGPPCPSPRRLHGPPALASPYTPRFRSTQQRPPLVSNWPIPASVVTTPDGVTFRIV